MIVSRACVIAVALFCNASFGLNVTGAVCVWCGTRPFLNIEKAAAMNSASFDEIPWGSVWTLDTEETLAKVQPSALTVTTICCIILFKCIRTRCQKLHENDYICSECKSASKIKDKRRARKWQTEYSTHSSQLPKGRDAESNS